jgi:hypothetical protein
VADGITTIEEAFKAAKLEELSAGAAPQDAGAPPAAPPTDPPSVESDQPSETDPETQALIDSLVEQPGEEGSPPSGMDDPAFWTQQTEVDGESVTLGELKNSYLRQKDYTQKTQALAEQRRTLEQAEKFLEAYEADPSEFARAMAVEYGWIASEATAPVVEVEIPNTYTQEEIDARLEEMLAERVSADPRVLQAQVIDAERLIDNEFDRIQNEMRISIPVELRKSLMAEAQQRQVYDFEILLKARMAGRRQASDNLIRSGAARPQSAGVLAQQPQAAAAPMTVEEAWAQAKAEAGR